MITIFTALYPEAKELIRALSLKKDMTQNHFQVFSDENNQIQIVITGASAIAAATPGKVLALLIASWPRLAAPYLLLSFRPVPAGT